MTITTTKPGFGVEQKLGPFSLFIRPQSFDEDLEPDEIEVGLTSLTAAFLLFFGCSVANASTLWSTEAHS
jgi:hypothetical protein